MEAPPKFSFCETCRKVGTDHKKCGRCEIIHYCSRECQIIDWKAGHSKSCNNQKIEKELTSRLRKLQTNNNLMNLVSITMTLMRRKIPNVEIGFRSLVLSVLDQSWPDQEKQIFLSAVRIEDENIFEILRNSIPPEKKEKYLNHLEDIPFFLYRYFSLTKKDRSTKLRLEGEKVVVLWLIGNDDGKNTILNTRSYSLRSNKLYLKTLKEIFNSKKTPLEDFEEGKFSLTVEEDLSYLHTCIHSENPHLSFLHSARPKEEIEFHKNSAG